MERIYTTDLKSKIEENITLVGWVDSIRDHGNLFFFHLRDYKGIIQVVYEKSNHKEISIKPEYCIEITGQIVRRLAGNINSKLENGEIEIILSSLKILSKCTPLPFEIENAESVSEELQLQYRYLYTRNKKIQERMHKCNAIIQETKELMKDFGFTHFDTPILTASSPEGARDFLVPSRLHKNKYYALPQAPQIFKQLLIIGGYEKYFQIAHVFRDEDARRDRAYGEFMQLDVEIAFPKIDEIYDLMDKFINRLFQKFSDKRRSMVHMSYEEALRSYGTDKPDLRNLLKIEDFSQYFLSSTVVFFKTIVEKGGKIKGIRINKNLNRKEIEKIENGCKFKFAYTKILGDEIKSSIGGFSDRALFKKEEETIIFIANLEEKKSLFDSAHLRDLLALEKIVEIEDIFAFAIIKDFPMYELKEGIWDFSHNPFSKPQLDDFSKIETILAYQYDLVCNGYEIASGAIRNHELDSLFKCFSICNYSEEEVKKNFPSLCEALKYGPAPSGGFAMGIERILMILTDQESVRKVVHFPMNTKGMCLLTGAPSLIDEKTLKELNIKNIEKK